MSNILENLDLPVYTVVYDVSLEDAIKAAKEILTPDVNECLIIFKNIPLWINHMSDIDVIINRLRKENARL